MLSKTIQEGSGWRWGFDPNGETFPFLLGSEDWALELTRAEFADFKRLSRELAETVTAIADQLMEEEKICCELSSELIWLEIEGYAHAYGLRFILHQGRKAEGGWPAAAVPALLNSVQSYGPGET
ncbi:MULTISPECIES: DUF1818 family protein [Synechocystis]|uniref:DUF1818 family protein n=1 Tax=Synechocystis salina LEGE 00031 TaxID=1828736 RepID=A0ABR9VPJ3_9SYNC|nr:MULTISPECIES: DUF1818 family protein [Synechocystis]MBD2654142.1 DUF1818 family protein [Synechocystis sp. FACHB-383]MBE9195437.1 DUF1818 family protein [Synechocystis sp. LEGE 06083]MBE9241550.1 DUF1818 family protein [Synechocystis salina LEGE 00041]MBE9253234.1 DUF1818 family protein [Synechocystis salina LEGE 00031]